MSELEAGTVMRDGSVYAGISPETGNMLFVMPADAPRLLDFNDTQSRVDAMNKDKVLGHEDWRLPTEKELAVIFANKGKGNLTGTFNEAGVDYRDTKEEAPGWYRSSGWGGINGTRGTLFKDGVASYFLNKVLTSVRYVRDGESPGLPLPPPYVTPEITLARQKRLKEVAPHYRLKIN